jgi:hypothetical protein
MPNQNRSCRAGSVFHIVVFGHPNTLITNRLHMLGYFYGIIYGSAVVSTFHYSGEFKNR